MNKNIFFLTIPGLRDQDLDRMPNLNVVFEGCQPTRLKHSFPCVTWPSQANMLTGKLANEHGVVANGFFWRDELKVEMWTAWNEKIESPQIWDEMKSRNVDGTSAAWFPMLSKGCNADHVCMPAPIHKPDGSEDLWCYTKPQEFYGELLEKYGHFPLQHFWGPIANIKSTDWIVDSAVEATRKFAPNFFYIYLPHLDYAAQKFGPNSDEALAAVVELDETIGRLIEQTNDALPDNQQIVWIAASEYVITEVDHVTYPNRMLREADLLKIANQESGGEIIDFANTPAWALVDHQFAHVFVKDRDPSVIEKVKRLFDGKDGFAEVLVGEDRAKYGMDHERSGDLILISPRNSWQAYYWWLDDAKAPDFARSVDIHRKPGYDPVELFFDMETKGVPLNAELVKGSHGAPTHDEDQHGVLLVSENVNRESIVDTEVFDLVMNLLQ